VSRRYGAPGAHLAAVGKIKCRKHAVIDAPHSFLVDHSPPSFGAVIVGHFPLSVAFLNVVNAIAPSADRGIERTGCQQYGVPNHLGLHTFRRITPEQGRVRIDGYAFLTRDAGLAESAGHHHVPYQVLHGPGFDGGIFLDAFCGPRGHTRLHQLGRQPVEQLGMSRHGSRGAEVTRRCHDPAAEHMVPKSIGGDACREGMCGAGQPLSERYASPLPRCLGFQFQIPAQLLESGREDFVARALRATTIEDVRLDRLDEPSNETRFGAFFVHLMDERLQLFQNGSTSRVLFI
jgi:hypothetical protein